MLHDPRRSELGGCLFITPRQAPLYALHTRLTALLGRNLLLQGGAWQLARLAAFVLPVAAAALVIAAVDSWLDTLLADPLSRALAGSLLCGLILGTYEVLKRAIP
jgi:hypothetical protein